MKPERPEYERRCRGCRLPEKDWPSPRFGMKLPGWCGRCTDHMVMAGMARKGGR